MLMYMSIRTRTRVTSSHARNAELIWRSSASIPSNSISWKRITTRTKTKTSSKRQAAVGRKQAAETDDSCRLPTAYPPDNPGDSDAALTRLGLLHELYGTCRRASSLAADKKPAHKTI